MTREERRRRWGRGLLLLALPFLAAVVYVWFTGDHRWKVLGVRIILAEWRETLWYATALLVAGLWLLGPSTGESRLGSWTRDRLRLDLSTARRRWSFLGCLLGGASGYLFAVHYYSLFPRVSLQALVVLGGAAGMSLLHWGWARAGEALPERFRPLRPGIYLAAWSGLISGPLKWWEARGTEPIGHQAAAGLLIGLGLALVLPVAEHRRRATLAVAGAAAVFLVALALAGRDPAAGARRVLLVTLDTTRADYLSCYGYPRATSRNLDRLAAEGVRFGRAFCQMGITDPSHASILTGAYPRTHGLVFNFGSVTGRVNSLAEQFLDRGFHTMAATSRTHVSPRVLNISGYLEESGPTSWMNTSSAAEAWRRSANALLRHRGEDLFLWVHFFDPHQPYDRHPGYLPIHVKDKKLKGGPDFKKPGQEYSPQTIADLRELYAAEIFYTDFWLGKLLDLVRRLDAEDGVRTLVVVTADHGEILGEYLDRPPYWAFGHGAVYTPGVHVPLIWWWPGRLPAGRVVEEVAESVDIAPTIMELMFQSPYAGQGASLVPAMLGEGKTDGRAVTQGLVETKEPDPLSAMVLDDWKLLTDSRAPVELFRLEDALDSRNLLDEDPAAAQRLFEGYRGWLDATPLTAPAPRRLSDREKKNLRALGYIVK